MSTAQRADLNIPQPFSERAIFLFRKCDLIGGFWPGTLIADYRGTLREQRSVDEVFVLSLCLIVPVWCPDFCSCCQGTTPPYHLALVTSWAYTHMCHMTLTKGERVHNSHHSQAQEALDQEAQSFCERGLLAYRHSCSQRGSPLSKHTTWGWL